MPNEYDVNKLECLTALTITHKSKIGLNIHHTYKQCHQFRDQVFPDIAAPRAIPKFRKSKYLGYMAFTYLMYRDKNVLQCLIASDPRFDGSSLCNK